MSAAGQYSRILAPAKWPILGYLLHGTAVSLKPLAAIYVLRDAGLGYGVVGLALTAELVGAAVAAPVQGRLTDRYGSRTVLPPLVVLHVELLLTFAAAVAAGWSTPTLLALTFAWGATQPTVLPTLRAYWGSLYPAGPDRDAAHALQSVLTECVFLCGPLVASALAAFVSATAAIVVAAGLSLVGVLLFSQSTRLPPGRDRVASTAGETLHPRRGWVLHRVELRLLFGVSALTGLGLGVIEILLPALAEATGSKELAGLGFACLALGSMVGGIAYASVVWRLSLARRLVAFTAAFGVLLIPLPLQPGYVAVCVCLLLAGVTLAPSEATLYSLIDGFSRKDVAVEVNAWISGVYSVALGIGSTVAGFLVHSGHVALAAGLPVGAAVLSAGLAARVPAEVVGIGDEMPLAQANDEHPAPLLQT